MHRNQPRQFETLDEAVTATRQAAIRFLARREYGAYELTEKLRHRGFPMEAVEQVVAWLQEKDLQSDRRFVEMYIRSRKSRGQGPVRLRAELQQLAINDELVRDHLESDEQEWVDIARQVCQKRFGACGEISAAERAKQQRFLQYRGFSFEQIKTALA